MTVTPRKLIVLGVVAMVLMGAGVLGFFRFYGPHMRIQENIRSFQADLPPMPAAAVPMTATMPSLPTVEAAALLMRDAPSSPDSVARGQVYYGYYCRACHGAAGNGRGPVGDSFFPTPTDLRSAKVRDYSDAQLLRAMLAGVGHEPVLPRLVRPEHRPPLVHYLRHLADQPPAAAPTVE